MPSHPRRDLELADLTVVEWAYDLAWEKVKRSRPDRDLRKDLQRQETLRRRLFALGFASKDDAQTLCERVLLTFSDSKPSQGEEAQPSVQVGVS